MTDDKRPLTKAERRGLAARAHHLKPELMVGRDGLSEPFMTSLREAFRTKELLKIKLLDTAEEDRKSLAAKLDALPDIHLVQNIGKTFILFRERDEEEETS